MEMREVGRSGIKVSVLGLGTMNFGADWHGVGRISDKVALRLVDIATERGVNFIDTADIYGYGAAESMLGRVLKGRRGKFVIATKVLGQMRKGDPGSGGLSARHIEEGLDDSLRRLGTDYVDFYMPHDIDPRVPFEESLAAFDKAVGAGKVRALGCSNFEGREWRQCLDWAAANKAARFEFNEIQFSLASPEAQEDLEGLCEEAAVGVFSWSPLGGGLLSGKYLKNKEKLKVGRRRNPNKAFPELPEKRLDPVLCLLEKVAEFEGISMTQTALGWILSKPWIASAIVGARTPQQLEESLAARQISMKAAALLDRAAETVLGK